MANNIFKKRDVNLDTFEDLNCKGVIASFSQGDRISDKLVLRLTNDKVPLDLTDVVQVRIDFRKPDGKLVFQYCTIEDRPQGLVSCILTTQTLAAPGKVYAEVTAKYPEGKDAVTRQFTFHVEEAIAGDKSIQSQNEWPMLERAIVAGDMLAGVDLVAIINAGELAKGAVKKTGDTMTGNLLMTNTTGAISQRYQAGATPVSVGWEALTNGQFRMYDWTNARNVFSYDPVADVVNINRGTNVLKKTGDTMTGFLGSDVTATSSGYGWKGGASDLGLIADKDGYWRLRDWVKGKDVFSYNAATELMNFNANSNLLKKTGDAMSGDLTFDGANKGNTFKNGANTMYQALDGNGDFYMYSSNTKTPIKYITASDTFNINAANTNVVKKAGDTMSGILKMQSHLDFETAGGGQVKFTQDPTQSSARGTMFYDTTAPTAITAGIGRYKTPTADVTYMGWGASPWAANTSLSVGASGITYKGNPISVRDKDGMYNLTLTADATNANAGYAAVADRKGSVVTVRMEVTRNVGSANTLICTLPTDLRPANTLSYTFLANDGSVVGVNIKWDGSIDMYTAGKQTKIVATYVVA